MFPQTTSKMLTLGLSATGFAGKQTTWRHLKDASYDFPFAAYLAEYGDCDLVPRAGTP